MAHHIIAIEPGDTVAIISGNITLRMENQSMPRYKESKGSIRFQTPVVAEFQRYLFYELANARQWNPDKITHEILGANSWRFVHADWTITYQREFISIQSKLPRIVVRQGLTIDMGNGCITIGTVGEE